MVAAKSFRAPKLGVGMIYAPALRPFLERRPDALDVLEIEPQTMWLADDTIHGPFVEFRQGVEAFATLPGQKLVHSVGLPLGGTRHSDHGHLALLRKTVDRLNPPWVSEHLSIAGTPHLSSGFLLPPLQTEAGARRAIENIKAFKEAVGRPVAVETGVAYLRNQPFEMSDGAFLRMVTEESDCGILLDLHNIYCNHRNGRLDWDKYMSEIPMERVWEVHLAGGEEKDGFYLDSHSGKVSNELSKMSLEVLRSLSNLGALNFEIFDTFIQQFTPADFDDTVATLRRLWDDVGHSRSDSRPIDIVPTTPLDPPEPAEWEAALTEAVWKAEPDLATLKGEDSALELYAFLARSFRGSILARSLPRLVRYLLLRDGSEVENLMKSFYVASDPKLYAPLECEAFGTWLRAQGEDDPWALALLDYDIALLRIIRTAKPLTVTFPGNPTTVFEALARRVMPEFPPPPVWEVEILPDQFSSNDFAQASPS